MKSCALLLLVGCGRIGFDAIAASGDARDPGVVLDAFVVPPIGAWWITTAETRGQTGLFVTRPFDDGGFGAACPEFVADGGYPYLLGHPTLAYVYAVEQQLEGLALGCASYTVTVVPEAAVSRLSPRATLDVANGVGFFTADGPAAAGGVYRFTFGADGVPTGAQVTDGPTVGQPILIDPQIGVYVGGQPLGGFPLDATDTITAAFAPGTTCNEPVDLAFSGPSVLSFCHDVATIARNVRDPLSPTMTGTSTGSPGPFDATVVLPGDRAVGARTSPPQLVLLDLNGGDEPTWTDGPLLPAGVSGLAASPDGAFVVATWPVNASPGTIAVFAVVGTQLVEVAHTSTIDTIVTAVAITHPS